MRTIKNLYLKLRSTKSNQKFLVLLVIVFSLANLSMTWGEMPHSLLTENDWMLGESQESPALSSMTEEEPKWESYNEWQCFASNQLHLSCAVHSFTDPDGHPRDYQVPSIRVFLEEAAVDFDFNDYGIDCQTVVDEWKHLIENSNTVCLYGAYLQDLSEVHKYWILDRIKTENGYWLGEYSNHEEEIWSLPGK